MRATTWLLLLAFQAVWADEDYTKYVKELGGLGKGVLTNIQQPDQYVPRYSENPPNASTYYGGGLSIPTQYGEDKIARCRSEKAQSDLYLRQECEGINLITDGSTKRPDVTVSANEKLATGMQAIAADPAETLEKYQWKYPVNPDGSIGDIPQTACPNETVEVPAVTKEETCSQYTGVAASLCQATLKVTVDPNWNYSCLETKYKNQIHTCKRKLLLACEAPNKKKDCTTSGIQAESIQADMKVTFRRTPNRGAFSHAPNTSHIHGWSSPNPNNKQTYDLTFGTIGDNYWSYGVFDRSMTLNIDNVRQLEEFTLKRVSYDDWLFVTVNGHLIYSSLGDETFTGKDGRVIEEVSGRDVGEYERSTSWRKYPEIDVRPYLVNGSNTIFTRTIVGGGGENAIIFQTYQSCETKCQEQWRDDCSEWVRRSQ